MTDTEGEPLPGSGVLLQLRWRETPCLGEGRGRGRKVPRSCNQERRCNRVLNRDRCDHWSLGTGGSQGMPKRRQCAESGILLRKATGVGGTMNLCPTHTLP